MRTSAILLLVLMGALLSPAGHAADTGLRAGTAIVDVTPREWPLTLRGSFFPKPAKTAHDPLHVRALAFENGTGRAVIVIVDVIYISRETLDPIKKKGRRGHRLASGPNAHRRHPHPLGSFLK